MGYVKNTVWRKVRVTASTIIIAVNFCLGCSNGAFAQSTGELLSYPGTTLSGLQSAQVRKSLEQCRRICSERTGCAGFDYSSSPDRCRLFAAVNSARDDIASTAETRYPVSGFRPPEPKVRKFMRYPNYDLFGFDLEQREAPNVGVCEEACSANQECKAFTFNAWNMKCFLKSGGNDLRLEPRATTGVWDGLDRPEYRSSPVIMEYYRSYIMSGSVIGPPRVANSRQQCEDICWQHDDCVAFSFASRQRECSMYDHADNRFPRNGVESGSKIQPRP